MLGKLSVPVWKVAAGVGGVSVAGGGGLLITYGVGGFGRGESLEDSGSSVNTQTISQPSDTSPERSDNLAGGAGTASPATPTVVRSSEPDAGVSHGGIVVEQASIASSKPADKIFDDLDLLQDEPSKGLEAFKTQKGGTCVNHVFGNDLDISGAETGSLEKTYFKGAFNDSNSEAKGCLLIQTKRTKNNDSDKWKGSFAWIWTLGTKDKGFIVVVIAKTDSSDKSLDVSGVAYMLKKEPEESDDSKWKIKGQQPVTTNTKITHDQFSQQFPKCPYSGCAVSLGATGNFVDSYWNWLTSFSSSGLQNIGDEGTTWDDENVEHNKYKYTWQQQPSGNKKITDWCEDLQWWDHMFANSDFISTSNLSTPAGIWTAHKDSGS